MREFNREEIDYTIYTATDMIPLEEKGSEPLKGKVMAALLFEPGARTRLSFESSICRLGGRVIGFAEPEVSSVVKGESLAVALRNWDIKVAFVSSDALKMGMGVAYDVKGKMDHTETDDLKGMLPELDVLNATRIQKERFPDHAD